MFSYETQVVRIQGLLRNSWKLYLASFKSVLVWSFIIALMYGIPVVLGYFGIFHFDENTGLHFSWIGLAIFIVFQFIISYAVIAILHTMHLISTVHESNFKLTLRIASEKVFWVYIGFLLYHVIITLGAILYVLPAVFVWVLFLLFAPLIIFDNQTVPHAFLNSAKMVFGSWWQTFFAVFIPYAISYFLRQLLHLMHSTQLVYFLVDVSVVTIVMPFFYAAMLVQYNNLKVKMSLPKPSAEAPRLQS